MIYFLLFLTLLLIYCSYTFIPTFILKEKYRKTKKYFGKKIYLTFDDGPSEFTNQLLELLHKYNIKATFFLVASFIKDQENVVEQMKKENHFIGLHSLAHQSAYLMGPIKTKKDFENSKRIFKKYNLSINFYRPPWGVVNLSILKYLKKENAKLLLWDVICNDWEKNVKIDQIKKRILKGAKGNAILCLHDGRGKNNAPLKTIKALEKVIPILLKEGYTFATVKDYEN